MLTAGMTSVTFRKRSVQEVASLAKKAGLKGIEWGGDVHVPPLKKQAITEALQATEGEGLKIFSYGSYYSPVAQEDYLQEAEKIFETCRLLNCDRVRIWAGNKWRREATDGEYLLFVERMRRVGELALKYRLTVCFEHHQNTYCDTGEHALATLLDINRANVRTYWQPIQPAAEDNLACIALLKSFVDTVHVYHWKEWDRFLLREGEERWKKYLQAFHSALSQEPREIPCLLEFCKDDAEENFLSDAQCLLKMLNELK